MEQVLKAVSNTEHSGSSSKKRKLNLPSNTPLNPSSDSESDGSVVYTRPIILKSSSSTAVSADSKKRKFNLPSSTPLNPSSDSESESDESVVDIGHIIVDEKCPCIYVRSPNEGKKRLYNARQYCLQCKKLVSNFAQHLNGLKKTHNTNEIKQIKEAEGKEKRRLLTLLRAKYNNEWNKRVIERRKRELLEERRPIKTLMAEDYGPCPHCLLWISRTLLWKHQV